MSVSLPRSSKICQRITGHTVPISAQPETRTADIALYLTDNTRVAQLTGWQPRRAVEQLVTDVHEWLRENEEALRPILG